MNKIDSTSDSVFCIPPPGKVDPRQPSDMSPRSRVIQSPQKGNTCRYYALQILRNEAKIGKRLADSHLGERIQEKNLSDHRKEITELGRSRECLLVDIAMAITAAFSGSFTQKEAVEFLNPNHKNKNSLSINNIQLNERPLVNTAIQDFCRQDKHKELNPFVTEPYAEKMFKVHDKLIQKSGLSRSFKKLVMDDSENNWEALSFSEKVIHQEKFMLIIFKESYRLKNSKWHPEQPIQDLITELKEHGPHFITGHIGQPYYEADPVKLDDKIEGRPGFGWKANSKRIEKSIYHCVVLVGAKTEDGRGYVYFLDPLDGSDPAKLTSQKVYVISYERLRTQIGAVNAPRLYDQETGKPAFFPKNENGENEYALHA